jgi:hypothetical protein
MTRDRLIVFVHFHKAGGTTIVNAARANEETMPRYHQNANPYTADGKPIRFWEFSDIGLFRYLDNEIEQGTTFLACEWGIPDLRVLANHPKVVIVTLLREPISRILSNFRYDYLNGYTGHKDVHSYVDDHIALHTMSNYYSRMLLGRAWVGDAEPAELVQRAVNRLELVDYAGILEMPTSLDRVASGMGWESSFATTIDNRTEIPAKARFKAVAQFVLHGRVDIATRAIRAKTPEPTGLEALHRRNGVDVEIYRTVLNSLNHAETVSDRVHI